MPPAAHVGSVADPAHFGVIIPPGSPDILINGAAAARMSDDFKCLLAPKPHAPNTLITGSATVIANFHPAVRVGDTTACGATVLVGSPTVLIGGPTFGDQWATVRGIKIHGSPAFIAAVKDDLELLSRLPDGAKLLGGLTDVTIVEYTGPNCYTIPTDSASALDGKPSGAVVGYNPNITLDTPIEGGRTAPTSPPLPLGHELVHASHYNDGTTDRSDPEAQAIGYGSHAGDSPTENSLRSQMSPSLGQRSSHDGTPGQFSSGPPGPVQ